VVEADVGRQQHTKEHPMSTTSTYTVAGMTCGHCVASVTEEVRELPGVEQVDVVLETGALTITSGAPIEQDVVRDAVEKAGYQLA
jgi:copper chaperone